MIDDLRQAIRGLVKAPGFSLIAIATLALGIGANAAVYSVIDAVLLRPLPRVAAPERLAGVVSDVISYPLYRDLRDQSHSFSGLAAFQGRRVSISGVGPATLVTAAVVSGNYFEVLGVRSTLGRTIQPSDDEPTGDPAVAVVSHRLWRERYGAAPEAIGRNIVVNNIPLHIVGVLPPDFRGVNLGDFPDVWTPIHVWPRLATGRRPPDLGNRGWDWAWAFGRLRDGVAIDAAEAELNVIEARTHSAQSAPNDRLALAPVASAAVGGRNHSDISRFVALLAGIVGFALLMACANVAHLMIVRATRRSRELAIRRAIGASPRRILSLLVGESVILSLVAVGFALLLAAWGIELFRGFTLPGGIALDSLELRFDIRLLMVSTGLALLTGTLFGVAAARHASRANVLSNLKDGPMGAPGRARLRQALVAIQIATCLLFLAGAALFIRSVQSTMATTVGFDIDHLAAAGVAPSMQRYDRSRAQQFFRDARHRILADPRIAAATWAVIVPLSGDRQRESVDVDGYQPQRDESRSVRFNGVGPDYFKTMGIPILSGRDFADADRPGAPLAVVVNQTMADRYWSGRAPIGGRVHLLDQAFTVVGVAADSTYESLNLPPAPHVYAALAQYPEVPDVAMIVRTHGPSVEAVPILREVLASTAPDVPVSTPSTMLEQFAAILMPQRFAATLLSVFGLAALALAAVGVYGVTAYLVAQRAREIGVRVALGAMPGDIVRLALAGTATPIVAGAVGGFAAAAGLARLASGFLPGVSPFDPTAFAWTAAALGMLSVAATLVPVRRALRIDPAEALRAD